MQPNLHLEIDKDKRICAELIARFPEAAEDPELLADTLDGISTLPEVIAAILRAGREDLDQADKLGERIEKMQRRKARLIQRADRRKSLALWAMQETGRKRIDVPDFVAYLGMSQAKVLISDERVVPSIYMRVKITPDKKLIAAALKQGDDVPGASLGNPQPTIIVKDS